MQRTVDAKIDDATHAAMKAMGLDVKQNSELADHINGMLYLAAGGYLEDDPPSEAPVSPANAFDKKCIIVHGNLSDGFTFQGPYEDFDEASEAADVQQIHEAGPSWIATLEEP